MAFRKAGHADAEAARVGPVRPRADELDQVRGVAEGVLRAVVVGDVLGRVAAESQDVLDTRRGVTVENGCHLLEGMADAGQVGHGRQVGFAVDADDQVVRAFSRVEPPAP